jgi:hypothetical protein
MMGACSVLSFSEICDGPEVVMLQNQPEGAGDMQFDKGGGNHTTISLSMMILHHH